MGSRAASRKTKNVGARIAGLKATESICPYCAVGCAQVVYTRDGQLVDIEGHPRSPINQGRSARRDRPRASLHPMSFWRYQDPVRVVNRYFPGWCGPNTAPSVADAGTDHDRP
jgi:molybdopterin-dependent oxidoreductase iron-sulfur protein